MPWPARQAPQHTRLRGDAFTFEGLKPGKYRVRGVGWDEATRTYWVGEAEVEIHGTAEQQVELELTSGRK